MSVLWTQMHQTLKCLLMVILRTARLSDGNSYALQIATHRQVVFQLHHVIQVHIATRMDVSKALTSCDKHLPQLSDMFIHLTSGIKVTVWRLFML